MKQGLVGGGDLAAAGVADVDAAEFDFEDGGLEGVEAGVPADLVVVVPLTHAVSSKHLHALGEGWVGGGGHSGVAVGAEVLGGVEAEGGDVAEGTGWNAVPSGSEGLGGVLDELHAGVLRERLESVHIGALAVEVDRHDGGDGDGWQRGSGRWRGRG